MTATEKLHPCFPPALRERDCGFLFIPKWIFLPYSRSLDRSIIHTANEDGLKMSGKDLVQVGIFILVRFANS